MMQVRQILGTDGASGAVEPLLRWAGSKKKLLPLLLSAVPEGANRYIEPFAGSAVLFLRLRVEDAILGDLNQSLIETYRIVQRYPRAVWERASQFGSSPEDYYKFRAVPRERLNAFDRAAQFVYLKQVIVDLCEKLNVTVSAAVLGNKGPAIVRWEEPLQPVVVNVRVGFVMPILWSATGRAFAAFVPFERVKDLIEAELRDASTAQRSVLPNLEAVQTMLAQIRKFGCASVTDTLLRGASGMAAPVFNHRGHVEAVIALLGVSGVFDVSPEGLNGRALLDATTTASRLMGYQYDMKLERQQLL